MSTLKVNEIQDTSGNVRRGIQTYAIISDEKANNTNGGTFTSGDWRTRDLNNEVTDPDGIVSVASNQFTLGAGSYFIEGSGPAIECNRHQVRLYDVTNSAVVEYGTAEFSWNNNGYAATRSFVSARVVISGNTTYELQHRCQSTKSSFGMGLPANFGGVEVFSVVKIYKEA
tara:strand:- start:239 stop:751 length:513 start_codon:yes stop_codon:yes gene_type:complete